ncbi:MULTISPECIES: hypothetical protein [Streptomyces]|nr:MULTISPECIES: hypothetical protein [Streptomyces]MCX0244603.1 hypothetical protein [Streptomyces drozdowiczii]OKJ73800.1 hypothetical protein AMK30_14785 [Streptomyces sp. CB02460]
MLTTGRFVRAALAALAAGALMTAGTQAASADTGVKCPPGAAKCDITAEDPGDPGDGGGSGGGTGGGSGGGSGCHRENGQEIPCYVPSLGYWNTSCYWKILDPQPPADDYMMWGNHKPDEGDIYHPTSCPDFPYKGAGTFVPRDTFFPNGTIGKDAGPTPAELAERAVAQMTLKGADIGIAPEPGRTGLVGLPVWMWNKQHPNTTGPQVKSVTAGAVTVTATAKVSKVVWNMGDGSSVTCTEPGEPYQASYGKRESPDCGHVYRHTSRGEAGNKFKVTATSTWTIHWEGGGESGDLTETRESATTVAIGELQVVG